MLRSSVSIQAVRPALAARVSPGLHGSIRPPARFPWSSLSFWVDHSHPPRFRSVPYRHSGRGLAWGLSSFLESCLVLLAFPLVAWVFQALGRGLEGVQVAPLVVAPSLRSVTPASRGVPYRFRCQRSLVEGSAGRYVPWGR